MKYLTILAAVAMSACGFASAQTAPSTQPLAIKGETIYTMSGAPINGGVILLRDGKIVQGREYMDKEQALQAVGPRE